MGHEGRMARRIQEEEEAKKPVTTSIDPATVRANRRADRDASRDIDDYDRDPDGWRNRFRQRRQESADQRRERRGERREGVRSRRSDEWEGKTLTELAQELADEDDAAYAAEYEEKYGHPPPEGDGNCWSAASETALEMDREGTIDIDGMGTFEPKNIEVVHGTPYGTGGDAEGLWYGHAWTEFDIEVDVGREEPVVMRWVRDASNGNNHILPTDFYYKVGNIDKNDLHRYTISQVHDKRDEHGQDGQWNRWER
jgi:hypothetical protein